MGHTKPARTSDAITAPITRPRIDYHTKNELLGLREIIQAHAHHDCRCREKREALELVDAILDAT